MSLNITNSPPYFFYYQLFFISLWRIYKHENVYVYKTPIESSIRH